ncbi:hypothetical protein JXE04_00460 [Patescibacteria group bacterium]|nr:hypothetical protein [Patescibacteria group bacterium]
MKKYLTTSLLLLMSVTLLAVPVFAETPNGNNKVDSDAPASATIRITNPLVGAGIDSPQTLIGRVINSILGVVGSLALVMFVYGGLIWMTSSGSSEQVKKGRDILMWAAIGLVIIFSAYGLVRFVIMGVGAGS